MILDVFTTLAPDHPAEGPGEARFLVAPPTVHANARGPLSLGAAVARLRAWGQDHPRALGGLLPFIPGWAGFDDALGDAFFRGVLLSPDYGPPFDLATAPLKALARHPALPIVVDCGREGFSRPGDLARLLEALPARPILLTHGAQLCISGSHLGAAAELFASYGHTYCETSGIYRQDFLEDQVQAMGVGRILYGSSFPRMDPRLEIERVRILPVTEEDRGRMLGGNGAGVFGVGAGA